MFKDLTIYPFGRCEEIVPLRHGRVFDVYRGTLGGRDVCLKMPVLPGRGNGSGACFESIIQIGSELFGDILECESAGHLDLSLLLQLEAETIRLSAGAWNHEVYGMGTFQCQVEGNWRDQYGRPFDAGFWPVMVMPYHRAQPLSDCTPAEKVYLFPRMLVSLWDALAARRHGDHSESNIMIDHAGGKFILIDPGVYLGCGHDYRQHKRTLFTTNAANYPLLFPHQTVLENTTRENGDKPARPSGADFQALGFMFYRILTDGGELSGVFGIDQKPAWYGRYGYGQDRWSETDLRLEKYINKESLTSFDTALSNLSPEIAALLAGLVLCGIQSREELCEFVAEVLRRRGRTLASPALTI